MIYKAAARDLHGTAQLLPVSLSGLIRDLSEIFSTIVGGGTTASTSSPCCLPK